MSDTRALRILHTSDWHLGRQIAGVDRTEDFRGFLEWLLGVLADRRPDLLLISGDVFDTTMPASDAQALYYDFLAKAAATPVGAVVVTAGNHDSPRFLRASRRLLGALRVFIPGHSPEEEVFVLRDAEGRPRAAVAAVPYLRDGDVRTSGADDADADRAGAWNAGVAAHYRAAAGAVDAALEGAKIPRIAMGHLFVTGARVSGEDPREDGEASGGGVRVGSLRNVTADVFGPGWDYVALGHIHLPQRVRGRSEDELIRFSGSPLVLDPTEAAHPHQIVEVELGPDGIVERFIDVPQPRVLASLRGTRAGVEAEIARIGAASPGAILEVLIDEAQLDPQALVRSLSEAAEHAGVHLAAVRTRRTRSEVRLAEGRTIDDLTPGEVFRAAVAAALDEGQLVREDLKDLEALFSEALQTAEAARREADARSAERRSADGADGTDGAAQAAQANEGKED